MDELIDRQANMIEVVCSIADIDRIIDAKQRRLDDIEQNWEAITRHMDCGELHAYKQHCCDEEIIIEVLKNAMRIFAVDAVEVVRCKDCEYLVTHMRRNGEACYYSCDFHDIEIEEDDFCSYGERRSDNG